MLGMRTFHEGGVMIRWIGPLGRMWALAIIPLHILYWIWSSCMLSENRATSKIWKIFPNTVFPPI